jgi:hypothetical protein
MNRSTVRLAAAALAAAVTICQLAGIALLAEAAPFPGDSVVVLPQIVIVPAASPAALREDARAAALGVTALPPT